MPKRTRIEIILDVLDNLARYPDKPLTKIALYSNLPYDRLVKILDLLESKDLLRKIDENNRMNYVFTEKGRILLREMKRLRHILNDFGLDIL
ncbi:MAG: hypothetical protein GSR79_03055 [Desulfurococcales archaeon]|nr:hypothetical protein [Desulfurococcales archaeon]